MKAVFVLIDYPVLMISDFVHLLVQRNLWTDVIQHVNHRHVVMVMLIVFEVMQWHERMMMNNVIHENSVQIEENVRVILHYVWLDLMSANQCQQQRVHQPVCFFRVVMVIMILQRENNVMIEMLYMVMAVLQTVF